MRPTPQQSAVIDCVKNAEARHLLVEAVAGAGKSTTLKMITQACQGARTLYVAFNKHIAEEMKSRPEMRGIDIRTAHSHGFRAIRDGVQRAQFAPEKYKIIVDEWSARMFVPWRSMSGIELAAITEERFPCKSILKMLDLSRLSLIRRDQVAAIIDLADRQGVQIHRDLQTLVAESVLHLMHYGMSTTSQVDHTDMIWLPLVMRAPIRQYQMVLVDECQDIAAATRMLIERSIQDGGRSVWVGDRHQSIYAFAGADPESFREIEKKCDRKLPLSTTFRCAKSIVAHSKQWVPHLEACDGAPDGEVRATSLDDLADEIGAYDMVLCRLTAPLIDVALELLSKRIPCTIRGKDIGRSLAKMIRDASNIDSSDPMIGIDQWASRERKKAALSKSPEAALDRVDDTYEALHIIIEALMMDHGNGYAVADELETMFSEDRDKIVLSTIHRAKGLEADQVFVIRTPCREGEQERNLDYVAATRAKRSLIYVDQ